MPAPAEIVQLVELFQRNYDQYCAPSFNETAVRHQFIDPFFAALGWDVNNTQGFAEQYKEVVHEDKVLVGDATKAPDYSFRIGKERKFFVEAKKPSVNIKHDIEPAYQLRRYAWSAKLPLSILTDFEEFSVYDCRMRPDRSDKAATGRILLLNFTDYVARWDEIAGIFSKAAVWQGALDRFAVAKAGKRGTAEVDDEFLAEIERWRELLARNLVLRNPHLRGHDVNWAVQQTIDRIVFLRICEARNLETYEQLRALLNGGHTYARLWELFRRADLRYNSGLFHFSEERGRAEAPDTLTPGLEIDDRVLKDIIEHLYYPQSPYEFSVLPADILGHVYERFLGKVIRLTPGRQVKIEEKPEVRKAGGVYYTPTYIVDYIVRQTVGPLLDGKSPAHGRSPGSPPRIADIACGSGSFLLGAYQYLLDWHLAYYLKEPERWLKGKRPALERVSGGATRLTIEERKRILMDHLYGVDIDPQAVEVTKLSLLLKVLEGEGVAGQLSLGVERVLPDLGRNIKCGNSLIGHDFYAGRLDLADEETARRVNAFDWHQEFPEVMAAGGFDAVIGDPPYGAELSDMERAFLESKYQLGSTDTAALMIAQARMLSKHGGINSFIVPKPLTYSSNWQKSRAELVGELQELVDTGKVWKNVKLEQVIFVRQKGTAADSYRSSVRIDQQIHFVGEISKQECQRFGFFLNGVSNKELLIAHKVLNRGASLNQLVSNTRGGMFQNLVVQQGDLSVIGGAHLSRYQIVGRKGYVGADQQLPSNAFLRPNSILIQNIVAHIENPQPHVKIIGSVVDQSVLQTIVILDTVNQLENRSPMSAKYILGILHSQLLNWYVYRFIFAKAIRTMHFDGPVTNRIPIRTINFANPAGVARHDRMVALVTQMLDLHARLAAEGVPHAKAALQRRIEATDRQIDVLVYELYGLTDAEIAVVEHEGAKGVEHEAAK